MKRLDNKGIEEFANGSYETICLSPDGEEISRSKASNVVKESKHEYLQINKSENITFPKLTLVGGIKLILNGFKVIGSRWFPAVYIEPEDSLNIHWNLKIWESGHSINISFL